MTTASTIRIRRARTADAPRILELVRDVDKTKMGWTVNKRRSFALQMRHVIKGANSHYCWVAADVRDGSIVGYAFASATYSPLDDGMWLMLTDLYVCAEHRGSGFGKKLMLAVRRHARKTKGMGFWLVTHPENTGAQKFYRRHRMRVQSMKWCFWHAA